MEKLRLAIFVVGSLFVVYLLGRVVLQEHRFPVRVDTYYSGDAELLVEQDGMVSRVSAGPGGLSLKDGPGTVRVSSNQQAIDVTYSLTSGTEGYWYFYDDPLMVQGTGVEDRIAAQFQGPGKMFDD